MAASIYIETESGTSTGPSDFRDSWGFERHWWADDEVQEPPICCPRWEL